jgi:Gpi18-like mannosyltransferase
MHYKRFWLCFLAFIVLNILLYFYIFLFNQKIPFSRFDYTVNAHHYVSDQRINGGKFNFFRALGQYDAQWYLKIASEGYPKNPSNINLNQKNVLNGLSYAFFPFYPLVVSAVNFFIRNVEISAFFLSNLLMLVNFISLYFVIKRLYSRNKALKTIFLLFFFPFSIFYRSYFTEGLFLLLLVWFSYFLIKKSWLLSALFLSLLSVTRPNGVVLDLLFLFVVGKAFWYKQVSLRRLIGSFVISVLPFIGWLWFCYVFTGNPLYWATVQNAWFVSSLISIWFHNLSTIFHFFSLSLHAFHSSRIDVLTIFIAGILLFYSRKKLKPELWWISFLLWLAPLFMKDMMSYSRYQIVSFPLFLYLAQNSKGVGYVVLLGVFCLGLFLLSLFFVNWYWIG